MEPRPGPSTRKESKTTVTTTPAAKDGSAKEKEEEVIVLPPRMTFEELARRSLPLATTEIMNSFGKNMNYWETEPWFVTEILPFLVLKPSETFLELGGGSGLVALQVKYEHHPKSIISYENIRGRHQRAELNHNSFLNLYEVRDMVMSPAVFVHANFCDPAHVQTLVQSNVTFCAIDGTSKTELYLMKILEKKSVGSRFLTNLNLVPFIAVEGNTNIFRIRYQVVKVDHNEVEAKKFAWVPKSQLLPSPTKQNPTKKSTPKKSTPKKLFPKTSLPSTTPPEPAGANPTRRKWTKKSKAFRKQEGYINFTTPDADASWHSETTSVESDPIWPNTTKQAEFLHFFIITVKEVIHVPANIAPIEWNLGQKGFVPYRQGTEWIVCPIQILDLSLPEYPIVELILNVESKLMFTMSSAKNDLFSKYADCEAVVKARNNNRGQPQQFEPSPTNIPANLKQEDITGTQYVFDKLIPENYVKILGISPNDFRYIDAEGVNETFTTGTGENERSREIRFDVENDMNASDYFNTLNPYYKYPVIFTGNSAKSLNMGIPWETLKNPNFTLDNPDTDKDVGITVTDELLFQSTTTAPFGEIIKHVNTPFGARGLPKSVTNFSIQNHPLSYMFEGPERLAKDDLGKIPPQPPGPLNHLNKCVDIVGRGSFMRWHCHIDGCIKWTRITEGAKLFSFILGAEEEDFKYVLLCGNKFYKYSFVTETMKGRLYQWVLLPEQVLVFPGWIPHSILALSDTLSFGGRIVTTTCIPRLNEAAFGKWKGFCAGLGFSLLEIQSLLYLGSGKVFYDLFNMKLRNPVEFQKSGRPILITYSDIMLAYQKNSGFSDARWKACWDYLSAFIGVLKLTVNATFGQTLFGAFFHEQQRKGIDRAISPYFDRGPMTPITMNVRDGVPYRSLTLPADGELDFYSEKDYIPRRISFSAAYWYKYTLASVPKVVLSTINDEFGVFAAMELQAGVAVSEFTGEILTADEVRIVYRSEPPCGRMHYLNTIFPKKSPPVPVFLDANRYAGLSAFYTESEDPNCYLDRGRVDGRVILILIARRNIPRGERITVPKPFPRKHNMGLVGFPDTSFNLQLVEGRAPTPEPELVDLEEDVVRVALSRIDIERMASKIRPLATPEAVQEGEDNTENEPPPGAPKPTIPKRTVKVFSGVGIERLPSKTAIPIRVRQDNKQTSKENVTKPKTAKATAVITAQDEDQVGPPEMPAQEPAVPGPSKPKTKPVKETKVSSSTKIPPTSSIPRPMATKTQSTEKVVEKKQGQVKKSKSMPELSKKTSRVKKVPESQGYFTEYAARRAMQAKKKDEYRKQLSADESNEEEGEEFTFAGHNLTARYAGPQAENLLLREIYEALPARRKLEIDGLSVSMFYPTITSWRAMNNRILELFKKKLENTCAICSFYGLKKQNATHVVPPPFDPFNDQSHYIRHYHNFHKRKWRCTICGMTDDTSKKISAHLDEMLSKPNEAHRAQQERDGIGKRGASTSKRHIPKTPSNKPRVYFINDKTGSDDEDEETESDTPPDSPKKPPTKKSSKKKVEKGKKKGKTDDDESDSDTPPDSPKQPQPKSSKIKVQKGKRGSKKTATEESEDSDEELTYETMEKKKPKKRKRQN